MATIQTYDLSIPRTARRFALSAVAGQVLFTLTWFILGFISPGFVIFGKVIAPYSAVSAPLSGLGLGPTGPFMNAGFIISGLLILAGLVGIFQSIPQISSAGRWTCIALFALSPVGMIIDGVYTIESFLPHMLGFLLGTGTPVISFLIAGFSLRQIPGWRRFSRWLFLASPLTLVLVILSLVTFNQEAVMAGTGIAGLTERILCVELAAWFVALGWKAYKQAS